MRSRLLTLNSSARLEGSYSRLLVSEFAAGLFCDDNAKWTQTSRDLTNPALPVLDNDLATAIRVSSPNESQRATAQLSEQLIDELKSADVIALGAPMYNWGLPAALKAWIDLIVRIGFSFQHSPAGIKGLLNGQPIVVFLTRGGIYSTPDKAANDFQKPYLKQVLETIGLQPEFILCEGTLLGEEVLQRSLTRARADMTQWLQRYQQGA